MRTLEEIKADVTAAISINDAKQLLVLADELHEHGTPEALASEANARGTALRLTGSYADALEQYERALALHEERGDRVGVANVTGNIGIVYDDTGDYPRALEQYERALALYEELGNRNGVASSTVNIGIVHANTGDYPRALEQYERALALHEKLGNRNGAATVTGNIGIVYYSTGDYPRAREHFERALALHEELGDRDGVARVTGNIGNVYGATSDYPRALEHFERALALYEELGNRAGVAHVTGNLCDDVLKQKNYARALELLEQQANMQMDNPGVRVSFLTHRARIAEHNQDLDAAQEFLQSALQTAEEAGVRDQTATAHMALRDLAQKRNDFAGYIEHNNEYNRISEEIRGKEATQKMAMMEAQRGIDAERRERDKERALLFGTLPESVARRILKGERVTGDHYENASVIFLDIAGFTSISDKIPPGHVVHLLEQIFSALDIVVDRHGVTKIKTIGDSYMAVAGIPDEQDDHAQRAAACAIEMLSTLAEMQITMPPELGDTSWTTDMDDIQVRIGVHCGPVTAGVIGTQRLQYDVWGDTVNVASRMESTSEPSRIHVSDAFADALPEGSPLVTPRGEIEVKGKGTMKTFWLQGTVLDRLADNGDK